MKQEELERRVKGYLQRMKRDKSLGKYDLDEQGYYEIKGGSKIDYCSRGVLEVVSGKFIDVIAYASQLRGFLGDWCSWDMPDNCNHGEIRKINVKTIPVNQDLYSLIESEEGKE